MLTIESLDRRDFEIVGFQYFDLGPRDFTNAVRARQEAEPDVISSTINSISNHYVFPELAAHGFSAEKVPVLSTSMGKGELCGMAPKDAEGHLASYHHFQSIDTPRNRRFVCRFRNEHGEDHVLPDSLIAKTLLAAAHTEAHLKRSRFTR